MCFDLVYLFTLLVQIAVICAVIAIFNIWVWPLLNWVDARVLQTLKIIIGLCIAIWVIWLAYDLITCFGGLRLRHR